MTRTLGPRLARKPLHLFWILDTSGSMGAAGKITALNSALRGAVPALRGAVADNPGVELLVRVVVFDHDARWHVAAPVPIERFEWVDVAVTPDGTTEVGRAIDLVIEQIRGLAAARRGMPPALVLVSDGKPTDLRQPTFGAALRALDEEPWGRKASRMAIGIGADADMAALRRFIGHDEIRPIQAANATELAHYLRWASTVVVSEVSRTGGIWDEAPDTAPGRDAPATQPRRLPPPTGPRVDLPPPAPGDARVESLPPPREPAGPVGSLPEDRPAPSPPPPPPPPPPASTPASAAPSSPAPPVQPPPPVQVDDEITW